MEELEKIVDNVISKWEGTRMIEKHFGEPEELLEELRESLIKAFKYKFENTPS